MAETHITDLTLTANDATSDVSAPRRTPNIIRIVGVFDAVLDGIEIDVEGLASGQGGTVLAIDAPRGTYDIERASLALRLTEARLDLADYTIRLIAFLFPDVASLADRAREVQASPRLVALALDEVSLTASLSETTSEADMSAPLVYARARTIANARHLNLPAYLKPINPNTNDARRDGFDGLLSEIER
jgi:citrate lyase beta subunit